MQELGAAASTIIRDMEHKVVHCAEIGAAPDCSDFIALQCPPHRWQADAEKPLESRLFNIMAMKAFILYAGTEKVVAMLLGVVVGLPFQYAEAQSSLPATSMTTTNNRAAFGVSDPTPKTTLDVKSGQPHSFTTSGWSLTMRLIPYGNNNSTPGSTIVFDKDVESNNYFLAGPSTAGDYYTGLTPDYSVDTVPNYVTRIFGNPTPSANPTGGTIPEGATEFKHNVLLNGAQAKLSLGIRTDNPKQAVHVEDGSILINASLMGNDGILFKDRAAGSGFIGDWGIQYTQGSVPGSANEGLNFWTPTGSPGGHANFRMFLRNNGNVGIGTGGPTAQLHTTGSVRFQGIVTAAHPEVVVIDASGNLAKRPYSSGTTLACVTANQVPKVTGINTLGCSQIFDNGTSVGIGISTGFAFTQPSGSGALIHSTWTAPADFKLYVNGNTRASGYFAISDERFKMNIKPLEGPLDKLKQVKGVTYNWRVNEFKDRDFGTGRQIGFVAQELAKVLPEAVAVDDQGYYSVNYDMVIPLLTEAVKEQQSIIERMQGQIDDNLAKIDALNERLAVLDQKLGVAPATGPNGAANKLIVAPNPFNASTTIKYGVGCDCRVQLNVTNSSGQEVAMLVNEAKSQGEYTYEWNTMSITPGVYTCTLLVDGVPVVKQAVKVAR